MVGLGVLGEEVFMGDVGEHIGVNWGACRWAVDMVWGGWGLQITPWKPCLALQGALRSP